MSFLKGLLVAPLSLASSARFSSWVSGWMAALAVVAALLGMWAGTTLFLALSVLALYNARY